MGRTSLEGEGGGRENEGVWRRGQKSISPKGERESRKTVHAFRSKEKVSCIRDKGGKKDAGIEF